MYLNIRVNKLSLFDSVNLYQIEKLFSILIDNNMLLLFLLLTTSGIVVKNIFLVG